LQRIGLELRLMFIEKIMNQPSAPPAQGRVAGGETTGNEQNSTFPALQGRRRSLVHYFFKRH